MEKKYIIDGKVYVVKNEDVEEKYKGNAGAKFQIQLKTGEVITTTNLWGGRTAEAGAENNADFLEEGHLVYKTAGDRYILLYDDEKEFFHSYAKVKAQADFLAKEGIKSRIISTKEYDLLCA